MCGICGFYSKKLISEQELAYANDLLTHRGPDDNGVEIQDVGNGYNLGLAHRRLSIIDLSSAGHQPMHSPDNRVSLVYNGEVFNFRELRQELKRFYDFKTGCDTEVIIASYLKWGISCVNHFNGMFAFALHDRDSGKLYLARDRFGVKPLYYTYCNGDLTFASELKALMVLPGFQKEIDQSVIGHFLVSQYISAPETIFRNTFKLSAGSLLVCSDGEVKLQKYWDVKKQYHKLVDTAKLPYEEAQDELLKILRDAVAKRMISDVPLGTFLSGGYDSTLITALAQEASDQPVKTFSIGFSVPEFDEAKYAKEVSGVLGTDHTEYYIDEDTMFSMVDSIPQYYDEPFADSSEIPSMLVAELAKKDVTVVLTGDAADEFFCGYNVYDLMPTAQRLDRLGGLVHGLTNKGLLMKTGLYSKLPFSVRTIAGNRNFETKTQFGSENYEGFCDRLLLSNGNTYREEIESSYHVKDWQIRRMLLDQEHYLVDDILTKVDRATMKYSLEARCPFLDYRAAEFSYSIPQSYKYGPGKVKKRIIKDLAHRYVPKEIMDRPKTGFSVPLEKWLRGPLKERLIDLTSRAVLKDQGIFDAEKLQKARDSFFGTGDAGHFSGMNYSKVFWSIFVFQMWWEKYMDNSLNGFILGGGIAYSLVYAVKFFHYELFFNRKVA